MRVTEGHDLAGNHTSNTLFPVTPPEQVRNAGPPASVRTATSDTYDRISIRIGTTRCPKSFGLTWLVCDEHAETPALRRVT